MEPNWKEEIIRILDKVQDTKVLRRVWKILAGAYSSQGN